MPAHDFEVEEALEEGVLTRWLNMIREVDDTTLTVEEMALDEQGRPQPTGRLEKLEADTLILAVGQEVDTGFLAQVPGLEISSDGVIQVDASMMTGRLGVFAGGDMVPAERTVTVATGHGKKAARHIDAYLRGCDYVKPTPNAVATSDRLNTWYYTDADKSRQPYLDLARRRASFEEVVGGLDTDTALLEARRCLSCGNCFECDTCYGVCPDNAIIKLGPGQRYEVNYDYCKGCGVCAEECPCGAIDMVKEVR
jgi:2-oxoacid:acceptor oxidoreductase delta subunit (pyruvate/2-ketoisovalerate family)